MRVLCSYRMVNCCTENDTQELYERTKKKAKFDTELYERTKKRAMNEGKEKKILNKKPKIGRHACMHHTQAVKGVRER